MVTTASPPVLLVGFRRPDLLARVIQQVRLATPERVYFAVDGPRVNNAEDRERCRETRKLATSLDWGCEVKTLFREENLGCGRAVSGAISWFFQQEEFGIILEEDCLPDRTFFPFAAALGERYREDDRVGMIGGFSPLRHKHSRSSTYVFVSQPMCWGWATWRRSWQNFDLLEHNIPKFSDLERTFRKAFGTDDAAVRYWSERVVEAADKRVDTWDYQWVYALAQREQLCALPMRSLTQNIGFDSAATHTNRERLWVRRLTAQPATFPIVHPSLNIDVEVQRSLNRHYFRVGRYTSQWYAVYQRLLSVVASRARRSSGLSGQE